MREITGVRHGSDEDYESFVEKEGVFSPLIEFVVAVSGFDPAFEVDENYEEVVGEKQETPESAEETQDKVDPLVAGRALEVCVGKAIIRAPVDRHEEIYERDVENGGDQLCEDLLKFHHRVYRVRFLYLVD